MTALAARGRITEANGKAIGTALKLISSSEGAVLLYSSGGKDRAGIVCALLMVLCDVPLDAIAADFALSQGLKQMLYACEVADTEEKVLRWLRDDGPELSSSASTMTAYIQAFAKRHGSLAGWLAVHADFGAEDVSRLRARMMQPGTVDLS